MPKWTRKEAAVQAVEFEPSNARARQREGWGVQGPESPVDEKAERTVTCKACGVRQNAIVVKGNFICSTCFSPNKI